MFVQSASLDDDTGLVPLGDSCVEAWRGRWNGVPLPPPSGTTTTTTTAPGSYGQPSSAGCDWYSNGGGCGALCIIQVATRGAAGLGADLAGCLLGDAVDLVNCAARRLYASGAVGEGVRDAINRPITSAAVAMAQSQGGKCESGPRGLQVCLVPLGADINVRLGSTDVRIQIYSKGGTTIGNAFITDRKEAAKKAPLPDHELFHTFQWAAAGGLPFAALYGAEYAKDGECNRFEEAAGFGAGEYQDCVGLP